MLEAYSRPTMHRRSKRSPARLPWSKPLTHSVHSEIIEEDEEAEHYHSIRAGEDEPIIIEHDSAEVADTRP
jgi:hypothetical protein